MPSAGRAAQCGLAVGQPPNNVFDDADVATDDVDVLDRKPVVRKLVNGGLRFEVVGVTADRAGVGDWFHGAVHDAPSVSVLVGVLQLYFGCAGDPGASDVKALTHTHLSENFQT
jgi:hypothetical protein